MREIKFRVWDIPRNTMWQRPIGLVNGIDEMYTGDPFEDLVYMQYTGLKDLHGKEIYEGDIVVHSTSAYRGGEVEKTSVVGFENAHFVLYFSYPDKAFTSIAPNDFKVIGNIYENLELLNKGDIS